MSLEIANNIRNQIGNRAFAMIGAKNLSGGENYLSFRIGRNAKSVNSIKVTLNAMDTYDVEYGRVHGTKYTIKSEDMGIYADMLHGSIESNTGMYTSL
jgi:hypothetical protein